MRFIRQISILSLLALLFTESAFAYIDPGTGATFVGALGPLLAGLVAAGAAFGVKYFWHPIKALFAKLAGKKKIRNE